MRRRKLGEELRTLRDRAGLTSGETAARLGWNQSKVSRIETGRSGVKPSDVALLLEVYEVSDHAQLALVEALTADSSEVQGNEWWHAYKGLLPPTYRDFISLESQACRVRTLEMSVVPGLLQTPEYARAVTRAALGGKGADQVDSLVQVRLARQDVLVNTRPLQLTALLDESVLHRRVGGPGVMEAQLRKLHEMAQLPHVRLQILPFGAGEHVGMTGPFVIFSFPSIADLDVVVLDHLTSSLYLERKEDLKAYAAAFTTLRGCALSPEATVEFIAKAAHAT